MHQKHYELGVSVLRQSVDDELASVSPQTASVELPAPHPASTYTGLFFLDGGLTLMQAKEECSSMRPQDPWAR